MINENYVKNKKDIKMSLYLFLITIIVVIDQATKHIAMRYNATYLSIFSRLFHLPPLLNKGMSLELFNMSSSTMFICFQFFGFFLIMYFGYQFILKYRCNKSILGEVFIIAGGIGNFIDRFLYNYVIDFIFFKVPVLNYIAICNIADFAITIGCFIIIFELLFENKFDYFLHE